MRHRAGLKTHGIQLRTNGQAIRPGIDNETGQPCIVGVRPDGAKDQIDIRRAGISNERFGSIQDKITSLTRREKRVGTNAQSRADFLNGDRAELFTLDQRRQILSFLCIPTPMGDGVGGQRVIVDDRSDRRARP